MSDFELLSIVLMILSIVVYDFDCIHKSYKKVTAPRPRKRLLFKN